MAEDQLPKDPADDMPEIPSGLFGELAPDPRDEEIVTLREEAGALKERLIRMAADTENLRKRAEREKAEATLYAATNFARDLLSVADSLSRALTSIPTDQRDSIDDATRALLNGVEVTERELLNVFQRYKIARVLPYGQKFDPNMHQAIFEVPTDQQPPGTVMQVLQAGFSIGDRCLRPAFVGVAKALPAPAPEAEAEPGAQVLDI